MAFQIAGVNTGQEGSALGRCWRVDWSSILLLFTLAGVLGLYFPWCSAPGSLSLHHPSCAPCTQPGQQTAAAAAAPAPSGETLLGGEASALLQGAAAAAGAAGELHKEVEAAAAAAGDVRKAEEAAAAAIKQAEEAAAAALKQAGEAAAAALKQAGSEAAAAAQHQPAPEPPQGPRWFQPHGYTLDPACLNHEDLYLAVFQNLRPWMKAGLSRADLEACGVPLAADDSTDGTSQQYVRFALLDNVLWITSAGPERQQPSKLWPSKQPLFLHMLTQVQQAARRFGLPDMEFTVAFDDISRVHQRGDNGGICPMMSYCKHPKDYDLLLPSGHFLQFAYDKWLEQTAAGDSVPWEAKEGRVVGKFSSYEGAYARLDRNLTCDPNVMNDAMYSETRKAYQDYSHAGNDTRSSLWGLGPGLAEQRKFKYTLNLDGVGCSTRFEKLLATGQTVIKEDSSLQCFFSYALRPWVHYAPTGFNGLDEVDSIVGYLQTNDGLARRIGENSKRWAHKHLREEGRLCYVKVLFEEMAKLKRYNVVPEDFPHRIAFEDELQRYFTEAERKEMYSGVH